MQTALNDAATTKKPFYWKLVRNIRRAFRSPLPNHRAYQALVRDKDGIEIGGPTKLFRRDLPIYTVARSLDGVNFSDTTVWEGRLTEGRTYRYMKRRAGRQFICDATDLSRIPAERYDFVLSSNSLEHIANPLRALSEWLRVLRPGGHLVLVLAAGTTEHDQTHLDEIVERHDYAMTPDTGDPETLRRRGLANFENRCLHHHVFDLALIERIFSHFELQSVLHTTTDTDHIAAARKP